MPQQTAVRWPEPTGTDQPWYPAGAAPPSPSWTGGAATELDWASVMELAWPGHRHGLAVRRGPAGAWGWQWPRRAGAGQVGPRAGIAAGSLRRPQRLSGHRRRHRFRMP
jgi:hypothetical protein